MPKALVDGPLFDGAEPGQPELLRLGLFVMGGEGPQVEEVEAPTGLVPKAQVFVCGVFPGPRWKASRLFC